MNTFLQRLGKWTLICGVSAIPSFIVAQQSFSRPGMALGVACFIALYTWISGMEAFRRFESAPFVRRTLRIGYGTRLTVSLIYPVGVAVDLLPGLVSVSVVSYLYGSDFVSNKAGFGPTLLITLVQGCTLNALLAFYMAVIYSLQRLFCTPPPGPESTLCSKCGYDLRASLEFGRCPECGTPCPAPSESPVTLR